MCNYCHKEGHPFKSCLAHLQKIEELARSTIGTKDLFDENVGSLIVHIWPVHSALWSSSSQQEWIVDSGATQHMTKHEHLLSNYRQQHNGEKVVIGDNSTIQVAGYGDVIIDTTKFGDVLHVPSVGPNLLSIYHITHTNKKVEFWSRSMGCKGHEVMVSRWLPQIL
jgi:hypothetical protein